VSTAVPFTVLIPARLASTRLPGKPLADIGGLPMVVRVAQRAAASAATRCVVAADDARILQACQQHGVEALLTSPHHASGSDRLAEACTLLHLADDTIVVNVQGDEPLIAPDLIHAVATLLHNLPEADMATAAHAIAHEADFTNPNVVKTVLDARGFALYFSRAAIPHPRAPTPQPALRHIGIYSYRAARLRSFSQLPPAPPETAESLEQLRALWHGWRIAVHTAPQAPGPGVDTAADLAHVRSLLHH